MMVPVGMGSSVGQQHAPLRPAHTAWLRRCALRATAHQEPIFRAGGGENPRWGGNFTRLHMHAYHLRWRAGQVVVPVADGGQVVMDMNGC